MRDKLVEVKKKNIELEKRKKLRVFEKGDQVLLRAVGLPDKLAQAWEGPYTVKKRIGLANYKLDLGKSGRKRYTVVHVNNIKKWHPDEVARVVLAQDDALDDGPPSLKLFARVLSPDQLFHINNLKEKYELNLTNTVGIANVPPHFIDTQNHYAYC